MKFLILLFVTFAFAESYRYRYVNPGDYSVCLSDSKYPIQVKLYAGNAFIDATLSQYPCYNISVGLTSVSIANANTNLAIRNGKIISLITNDYINNFDNSTFLVNIGQIYVSSFIDNYYMDSLFTCIIFFLGVLVFLLMISGILGITICYDELSEKRKKLN
jgi:hypothetical protein